MDLSFEVFAHPAAWVSLGTLTFLEIVLGIDNIIFISLITQSLPEEQRKSARYIGLMLALVLRITMLMLIGWIMGLTYPLFTVMDHEVTGRSLILLLGGIFLIYKSTNEIHHKVAKTEEEQSKSAKRAAYFSILIQIALLDLVFSFDSILTAIGLAKEVIIMVIAVIISILVMMIFTEPVGKLITKYPTLQILALSFLIMIGVTLIMEGLHFEIDKKIVYVSVLFSLSVEMLNIRFRKKSQDG
jgi:predicted tellurium resistance membrane protein TerC